jgi:hypothetical protein
MTAIHVPHAAEKMSNEGPTGQFVEVIDGRVEDAGGNVHYSGSADACLDYLNSLRQPSAMRLVPTKIRPATKGQEIVSADTLWRCV